MRKKQFEKYYPGVLNKERFIASLGVKAVLITSAKVEDKIVYALAKEVFEHLNELQRFHPALDDLKRKDMLKGFGAPPHPGALKYYKEKGLDKFIDSSLL